MARTVPPGWTVKKLNGRDALLRVRDGKLNTDAEHRVPTRSALYIDPNFFTALLPRGDFGRSRSSRSEFDQIGYPDLLPGAFNAAVRRDSDKTRQSSSPKVCLQVERIGPTRSSKDHIPERGV